MTYRREAKRLQTRLKKAGFNLRIDSQVGPVTVGAMHAYMDRVEDGMRDAGCGDRETGVGMKPTTAQEHVFDKRTEKYLQTLSAGAQRVFRPFVARGQAIAASMGVDWVMISGTRTYAEQAKLRARWKSGRGGKAAAPGYSNHNFGIAGDFGCFRNGRYLDGSKIRKKRDLASKVHRAIAAIADDHGINWGGDWKGRDNDPPHFEVKTGLTMKQKRDRTKSGEDILA